jgi:hypothetical protein
MFLSSSFTDNLIVYVNESETASLNSEDSSNGIEDRAAERLLDEDISNV